MNISEVEYNLNKDNKFYWFISSIGSNGINRTFLELLRNSVNLFKEDINKPIYQIRYDWNDNSKPIWKVSVVSPASAIFDLTYSPECDWSTDFPISLVNFLKSEGLDFTISDKVFNFNRVNHGSSESIDDLSHIFLNFKGLETLHKDAKSFSEVCKYMELNFGRENNARIPTFLKCLYEQLGREDFIKEATSKNLLHSSCVGYDSVLDLLVNEFKLDVNFKDKHGYTPAMLCKTPESLKILLKREDIDLFAKNNKGKDCLYSYGTLYDKQASKELLDLVREEINNKSKSKGLNYNDIMLSSNKETLLAMVKSEKNKKEVEDFIKKSNLKDISDIFDEKGRSLEQICVSMDNWSKYPLFKDCVPADYKDNFGFSALDYMLVKQEVKNPNQATKVLSQMLCDIPEDTGLNVIRNFFKNGKPISVPKWFIGNSTASQFLEGFLGVDVSNDEIDSFKNCVRANPYFNNLYLVEQYRVDIMKNFALPYFTHIKNNNLTHELNNLELDNLCSVTKDRNGSPSPECSAVMITNLRVIHSLCKDLEVDFNPLFKRFEEKAISYLLEAYRDVKTNAAEDRYVLEGYLIESLPLIEALIDFGSQRVPEAVTYGYINDVKSATLYSEEQQEVVKKIEASMLSLALQDKNEVKPKKLKI